MLLKTLESQALTTKFIKMHRYSNFTELQIYNFLINKMVIRTPTSYRGGTLNKLPFEPKKISTINNSIVIQYPSSNKGEFDF